MTIEDHVPSLETCKRMKELGLPQKDADYYWIVPEEYGKCDSALHTEYAVYCDCLPQLAYTDYMCGDYVADYRAPLLSEILEELPIHYNQGTPTINKANDGTDYVAHYVHWGELWASGKKAYLVEPIQATMSKNPAEAAALLWIKLREEGIIQPNT